MRRLWLMDNKRNSKCRAVLPGGNVSKYETKTILHAPRSSLASNVVCSPCVIPLGLLLHVPRERSLLGNIISAGKIKTDCIAGAFLGQWGTLVKWEIGK